MPDLPTLDVQLAQLIVALRNAVIPPPLWACLERLTPPTELPPDDELLERTRTMTGDADLRHWLQEQTDIRKGCAVLQSIEMVLASMSVPTHRDAVLAHVASHLLATPQLLTIVRLGLQTIRNRKR